MCIYIYIYVQKYIKKLACDRIHNVKAPPPSCKSKHINRSSRSTINRIS